MTDKIIDNNSAGSKLLKIDYPELEVIGVNAASTIEEWFSELDPDNGKVFLPFNADELRADHEKLRDVIHGIETKGFRNKIVLPYEGMDADTMEKTSKMWRPEWTKPKLPTAKGIDIGEKTKIEAIALDTEVGEFGIKDDEFILKGEDDIGMDKPYIEVAGKPAEHIDPDDEMKDVAEWNKDETVKTDKKRKRSF